MKNKLLDFENDEKGFEPFVLTADSVKKNIGKLICYVDFVEPNRGTYFVRRGRISGKHYSKLMLDNNEREVDVRDLKAIGIEKTNP